MIKRIIIASYVLIGLVLFKFAFSYGYNEWVNGKYEEGDYTENYNLLEVANINEPYIVYYNNGNVMYQRQDYELAIEYFEKALTKNPPEEKECLIRINLVLSKLALLGEDAFSPENIEDTIELLEECLNILSEKGCATDEGDGHNNRAQRLYDEIKEMLDQAKQEQQQQQQQQQSDSDQSDSSNQSESSDPSDGSNQSESSDPSDGSNQSESSDPSDGSDQSQQDEEESKRQSEEESKKEQRQSEIEDELEKRMSDSNDQRQEERKKSRSADEDWNWNYDEVPVW